jgi:hypothetical protein
MRPEHVERAESVEPSRTRLAWRRAVILVLPVLYVAGTAVKTEEPSPRAWLAIAIGLVAALVGAVERPGETAGRARDRLWTSGALALTIASAALTERWAWVAFAREIALIGAGTAAVRSIGAIDADPGLAARATEAIAARGIRLEAVQRVAVGAVVLAWGTAALLDALAVANVAPAFADGAPIAASAGGAIALFVVGATALLVAGLVVDPAHRRE